MAIIPIAPHLPKEEEMSQQEVRELAERISPTLIGLICGAEKQFDVALWREGDLEMTLEQLERLRVTRQLYDRVASAEGHDAAWYWLIASRCNANGDSPAVVISEDRFEEARASAVAVIECLPV